MEREHLGGICLNWGCIPTKALLRSAEVFELMRHAQDYGLAADNVRFDAEPVIKRSRDVAGRLSRRVEGLLKKNKVEVIWGEARLTAPGQIRLQRPRDNRTGQARDSREARWLPATIQLTISLLRRARGRASYRASSRMASGSGHTSKR